MNDALQYALSLLIRRDHSVYELTNKLKLYGCEDKEITQVLQHCQHYDYQNDSRFAEQWCRMRVNKGYGPVKIVYELKQHRLSSEVMHQVSVLLKIDWVAQARIVLRKHAWRFKATKDPGKASRFLLARGFPPDAIRLCLKERSEYENR